MNIFAQPFWLLIGLIVCLGAALFIRVNISRRKRELRHFAAPRLLPQLTANVSFSRRRIKNILLLLALACLFAALARPQYGNRWVETRQKGIDILIGVDVSKSMLVRDVAPNRLERAKLAIRDFTSRLEGDRVGLLPFAGTAFLMCPLTTDYQAFNNSLDALDVNTIPLGGTDIGTAVREAAKALESESNHKILILVTDGEDLSEDGLKAAEEAAAENMTIYTIGVGTPQGELIPVPDTGKGKFVQDAGGKFVTSRLDETTLTKIAEITSGLYVPLGNMGQGFDTVYEKKLALVPKEEHDERKRKVPIERFPWPLAAAVFFLSADFLITGRKSVWALRLPFVKTAGRRKKGQAALLGCILLLAAFSDPFSARASEGEELYRAAQYEQAAEYYQKELQEDEDNSVLHFNLGDSLYMMKQYEKAAKEFDEALQTDDLSLQAKSYFNQGKTHYFMGHTARQTDPEHTVKEWEKSVEAYEASLQLEPDDDLAKKNLDFVKGALEQLKKDQEQEEKENNSQCKNPQHKDNDENSDEQEQENKEDEKKESGQQEKEENKKEQQEGQDKKEQGEEEEQEGDKQEKDENKQKEDSAQSEKQNDDREEENKDRAVDPQDNDDQVDNDQQQAVQPSPADNDEQPDDMSRQDIERRLQGKMTVAEAEELLESLKGEQGELNFIPGKKSSQKAVKEDW